MSIWLLIPRLECCQLVAWGAQIVADWRCSVVRCSSQAWRLAQPSVAHSCLWNRTAAVIRQAAVGSCPCQQCWGQVVRLEWDWRVIHNSSLHRVPMNTTQTVQHVLGRINLYAIDAIAWDLTVRGPTNKYFSTIVNEHTHVIHTGDTCYSYRVFWFKCYAKRVSRTRPFGIVTMNCP